MSELSDYRRIVSDPLEALLRQRIAKATRERDEAVRLLRDWSQWGGGDPETAAFLATVEDKP